MDSFPRPGRTLQFPYLQEPMARPAKRPSAGSDSCQMTQHINQSIIILMNIPHYSRGFSFWHLCAPKSTFTVGHFPTNQLWPSYRIVRLCSWDQNNIMIQAGGVCHPPTLANGGVLELVKDQLPCQPYGKSRGNNDRSASPPMFWAGCGPPRQSSLLFVPK